MIVSKIKRGGAASARHVSSGMHMRMNLYFISSSPARQQLSCVPLASSKDIEFPTRVCQWMICSSRGRGPATSARPFGYFSYIGKGNEKRWSRFSATLCVYQLIRCYSFTQRTGQELAFLASAFNCFSLKAVLPLSNASQYFGSVFSVAM